jgi:uncharacterized Zn-binding protein involved in type VI secretion
MPAVARVGDKGEHAPNVRVGRVLAGSPTYAADGIAVARQGDLYLCSKHGPQPIISGSPTVTADGLPVARIGDMALCGARIVEGSPTTFADGV